MSWGFLIALGITLAIYLVIVFIIYLIKRIKKNRSYRIKDKEAE